MRHIILASAQAKVGMQAAIESLRKGSPAIDIIESGIHPVETDTTVSHVGRGGDPNLLGEMECDAAVVDGRTHNVGVVAGLTDVIEAFSVARKVMEESPHVAIGGLGAALFAAETGIPSASILTDSAQKRYEQWKRKYIPQDLDLSHPFTSIHIQK